MQQKWPRRLHVPQSLIKVSFDINRSIEFEDSFGYIEDTGEDEEQYYTLGIRDDDDSNYYYYTASVSLEQAYQG